MKTPIVSGIICGCMKKRIKKNQVGVLNGYQGEGD